jgi:hypothetical protein
MLGRVMRAIGQLVIGGLMGVVIVFGSLAIYSMRAGLPMPWDGLIG